MLDAGSHVWGPVSVRDIKVLIGYGVEGQMQKVRDDGCAAKVRLKYEAVVSWRLKVTMRENAARGYAEHSESEPEPDN